IEASWIACDAVVPEDVALDEGADRGRLGQERRQAPLQDLLFPMALLAARRVLLRPRRQMPEPRDDAAQLEEMRVLGAQRLLQVLEMPLENGHVGTGRDGQDRVVVTNGEGAGPVLELKTLGFQHSSVLVAENGEEHLVLELGLERIPLDIEGARARRR